MSSHVPEDASRRRSHADHAGRFRDHPARTIGVAFFAVHPTAWVRAQRCTPAHFGVATAAVEQSPQRRAQPETAPTVVAVFNGGRATYRPIVEQDGATPSASARRWLKVFGRAVAEGHALGNGNRIAFRFDRFPIADNA
jgi:hypothetical protein